MMFLALCSKSKGIGASRALIKRASDATLLRRLLSLLLRRSLPQLQVVLLLDERHLGDADALQGASEPLTALSQVLMLGQSPRYCVERDPDFMSPAFSTLSAYTEPLAQHHIESVGAGHRVPTCSGLPRTPLEPSHSSVLFATAEPCTLHRANDVRGLMSHSAEALVVSLGAYSKAMLPSAARLRWT